MALIRQDAWNQDEDLLLAETVLRHIREGGTQLAAFEEVAERLSRTSAACGFRWNSSIRKKYQAAIQLAKKARKEAKRHQVRTDPGQKGSEGYPSTIAGMKISMDEEEAWFDQMIMFLTKQKEKLHVRDGTIHESVNKLQQENEELKKELEEVKEAYHDVREDYQLMIHALQRASKKEKITHP
ncbi:RsfA family transcriptional regulator [Salipaludibacillus keqinensis]|uniref:RsfA family transcriptional regulator n=1 Tax=Salipaludibacillus keqinensis TaxID=2045207 RepID=A0A323TL34_9BACI|nr:RsfA family transcriptional regulator [Salipaludibacillus keqinensis]PYZ93253.1 RsfA family transcriptional regulator [Salipaludibacillus keqinensis]